MTAVDAAATRCWLISFITHAKLRVSDNLLLRSLSYLVSNRALAVGSIYGVTAAMSYKTQSGLSRTLDFVVLMMSHYNYAVFCMFLYFIFYLYFICHLYFVV